MVLRFDDDRSFLVCLSLAFGMLAAPTFFVGNEMFWGNDRLHFVEAALDRG